MSLAVSEKTPVMGTGALVGFRCTAPVHASTGEAAADHLTIVDKQWAYCPSNARATGHDWQPTGGISLGELELVARAQRVPNGGGAKPKR